MKIIKYLIISILLLQGSVLFSSFRTAETIGARALSMGGAFVGLADDVYAVLYNPAGLVNINSFELSAEHNNPYDVDELYQNSILFGANLKRYGALGFSVNILEYKYIYRESTYIISYGNFISKKFMLGINLKYFNREIIGDFGKIPTYSFTKKIGVDISSLITLSHYLSIGATAFNVNKPEIIKEEGIPIVKFGFAFKTVSFINDYFHLNINNKIANNMIFVTDIFKEFYVNGQEISLNIISGLEFKPNNFWAIRIGTDYRRTFTAGIGFYVKKIVFNYCFISKSEIVNNNNIFSLGIKF